MARDRNAEYYHPGDTGFEAKIKKRLEELRRQG
jgi:replication-associated recombination protein RarA